MPTLIGMDVSTPTWPALSSERRCRSRALHRCVEGNPCGRERTSPDERQRVASAVLAVHPRILPFDRERARIPDAVERPQELLEIDVPPARRDEVPAPLLLPEPQVGREDRAAPVQTELRVLDVHVVDPIGELKRELGRIQELMSEVR